MRNADDAVLKLTAWRSDLSESPGRPGTPRLADMIEELDDDEVESGLWHDALLTLGARLRPVYGNAVELDARAVAYVVTVSGARVFLTCTAPSVEDALVSISCRIPEYGRESPLPAECCSGEKPEAIEYNQEIPLVDAFGPDLRRRIEVVRDSARSIGRVPQRLDQPGRAAA